MTDKSLAERLSEATNGINLYEHWKDKDWHVRCQVALHDFTLDKLAKDKDWRVRAAVASRIGCACGLDEDTDPRVRICAEVTEHVLEATEKLQREVIEAVVKGGDEQCDKCNSQTD